MSWLKKITSLFSNASTDGNLKAQRDHARGQRDAYREKRDALRVALKRAGFVPPGHFYSPIPDMEELERRRSSLFPADPPTEVPGVAMNIEAQEKLLLKLGPYLGTANVSEIPESGHRFHLDNLSFNYADGLIFHALLRHLQPRRIIEAGSGYSSACLLDTIDAHLDVAPECLFIEPYPEVLHQMTRPGDWTNPNLRLLQKPIQDVPLEEFQRLQAGDILFIDTSHVSKIGSDVNRIIFEILPSLSPGVWIHFHDIGPGFEYPETWIFQNRYFWNEAYLLRAFLQYNPHFTIRLWNPVVLARPQAQAWAREHCPHLLKFTGMSLWMEKTGP